METTLILQYIKENLKFTKLIKLLRSNTIGVSYLSKPQKIYFNNKYTFEIGGKNKTRKQIIGIENTYIADDDIEIGFQNKIPIWLFGFLY